MRLPTPILEALQAAREAGATHRVVLGGKHYKIYVNERMVGVLSKCLRCGGDKPYVNLVAKIRRAYENRSKQ